MRVGVAILNAPHESDLVIALMPCLVVSSLPLAHRAAARARFQLVSNLTPGQRSSFMVSVPPASFADAESAEDDVQNVLCHFLATDFPKSQRCGAEVDRPEVERQLVRNACGASVQRLLGAYQRLGLPVVDGPGYAACTSQHAEVCHRRSGSSTLCNAHAAAVGQSAATHDSRHLIL